MADTPQSTNIGAGIDTTPDTTTGGGIGAGSQAETPSGLQAALNPAAPAMPNIPAPSPDAAPTADMVSGMGAQAQADLPRFKRTVGNTLKGMLLGQMLGGPIGMVAGAVSPTKVQETATRNTTFANAQAANAVAEAGIKDQQLHALPQQIQDEHNLSAANTVKAYSETFGSPDLSFNNTGPDAMNAIKNAEAQGGLGHMLIVNTGKQIFAWDMSKVAGSGNIVDQIQLAGKISGNTVMSSMTAEQWKSLPKESQGQYIEQMNNVVGVTTPAHTLEGLRTQLSTLQQYQATLAARTDMDQATKDKALKIVQQNTSLVKQALASQEAGKTKEERQKQQIEQENQDHKQNLEDQRKMGYAFDKNGDAYYESLADANKNGHNNFEPQTPTTIKADLHDQRVLNDVALKSERVRMAARALPQGSTVGAALAKVLADNPNTTANSYMKEKAYAALSKQEKQYAISVLELRESSMGLQKVLTGTARANETQLQALLNTLPGLEPDAASVEQKLYQFNQNIEQMRNGIPRNLPGMKMVKAPTGPTQSSAPAGAPKSYSPNNPFNKKQ